MTVSSTVNRVFPVSKQPSKAQNRSMTKTSDFPSPTVEAQAHDAKSDCQLVAHIAGALMAGGRFTAVPYAVRTAREIVAAAYSTEVK